MMENQNKSTFINQVRLLSDTNLQKLSDKIAITDRAKYQARETLIKANMIETINYINGDLTAKDAPTLAVPDGSQFTLHLSGSEIGSVVTSDSTNRDFSLVDFIQLPINQDNNKVINFFREFQEIEAIGASQASIIGKDGSILQFVDSVKNLANLNQSQSQTINDFSHKYYSDNPDKLFQNLLNLVTNPSIIGVIKRSESKQIIHRLGITELSEKGVNDKQILSSILKEGEKVTFPSSGHYSRQLNFNPSFFENRKLITISNVTSKFKEVVNETLKPENEIYATYVKSKAGSPATRIETKLSTIQNPTLFNNILVALKANTHAPVKELIPQYLSDKLAKKHAYLMTQIVYSNLLKNWKGDINDIQRYRTN